MNFELAQESNKLTTHKYQTEPHMKKLCRQAVSEGSVLLKNDGTLPLKKQKFALFGRCQINTFFVGYGSGGDVIPPYQVSILEGLLNQKANINQELMNEYFSWTQKNIPDEGTWGNWPLCFDEMDVPLKLIKKAASDTDIAVMIIGRSAGEDRDIKLEKGSWYLNDKEKNLIKKLRKYFKKLCIVINSGSIMDTKEILSFEPNALLYVWQAGQEMGNGVADILLGKTSPSGKLTDTIAKVMDYPSTKYFGHPEYNEYVEDIYVGYRYFNTFKKHKIIYPFGYGLTYSKFNYEVLDIYHFDTKVRLKIKITNLGNYKAKEVIQVYLSKPNGLLGNPKSELVRYQKTKRLKPKEEQIITITFDIKEFAAYDDCGKTGYKNAFVLEKGIYKILLGFDSLNIQKILSIQLKDTQLISVTQEACAPIHPFKRMVNRNGISYEDVPLKTVDSKERILKYLPKVKESDNRYCTFGQVIRKEISLDSFVSSLDFDELETLTRGSLYAMNSIYGPDGNAGTFAASSDKLFAREIPTISTNDGPSGVRLSAASTQIPNGVLLASTFNDRLILKLGMELGKEVRKRGSHVLLAPGMNIHRNPLCGRNFEYFSEDPYLTGKIASNYIKGVQKAGAFACPKHFACNSQEYQRHVNDSRVSQRALREIYLKAFKLAISESNPQVIMTSYNKINGEWAYYNHDLVRIILRDEMHFDGVVITDWWMQDSESVLFDNLKKQAYRIRATVDVYMPGSGGTRDNPGVSDGTLLYSYQHQAITLDEIRYCAKNVLKLCLKMKEME